MLSFSSLVLKNMYEDITSCAISDVFGTIKSQYSASFWFLLFVLVWTLSSQMFFMALINPLYVSVYITLRQCHFILFQYTQIKYNYINDILYDTAISPVFDMCL